MNVWETMKTGDKHDWSRACFHEESLGKIYAKDSAFLEQAAGPWIRSLESADYFGTSEHLSGRKKEES